MAQSVQQICAQHFPIMWERLKGLDVAWMDRQQYIRAGWFYRGSNVVWHKSKIFLAFATGVIHSSALGAAAIILKSPPIRKGVSSEHMGAAANEVGPLCLASVKVTTRLAGALLGLNYPGSPLHEWTSVTGNIDSVQELKQRLESLQQQRVLARKGRPEGGSLIDKASLKELDSEIKALQHESNALVIDYVYGQRRWWELYRLSSLKKPIDVQLLKLEERDMNMASWLLKRLVTV